MHLPSNISTFSGANQEFLTFEEAKIRKRNRNDSAENAPQSKKTAPNPAVPKATPKPPAIVAYAESTKDLSTKINVQQKNKDTMLFLRKDNIKIQNQTKEDFEATKRLLEQTNIKLYIFTLKDEKPFTLLLKNLSTEFEESELKAAINEKIEGIKILNIRVFSPKVGILNQPNN